MGGSYELEPFTHLESIVQTAANVDTHRSSGIGTGIQQVELLSVRVRSRTSSLCVEMEGVTLEVPERKCRLTFYLSNPFD